MITGESPSGLILMLTFVESRIDAEALVRRILCSLEDIARRCCSAHHAETRTGVATLPLHRFAPSKCAICGTLLKSDIYPEYGCVYRTAVNAISATSGFKWITSTLSTGTIATTTDFPRFCTDARIELHTWPNFMENMDVAAAKSKFRGVAMTVRFSSALANAKQAELHRG